MTRYFGYGKESTYNPSGGAGITRWVDIASESLTPDASSIYPDNVSQRDPTFAIKGPFKYAGDISCWAQPTTSVGLMTYALGTVSTDAQANSVYKHWIEPSNTIPTFTFAVGVDEVTERTVSGAAVNGFTIDYKAGEAIGLTYNIVGANETLTALDNANVSFPTENPFGFADVTMNNPTGSDTILEALSITYTNNIADDAFSLGSRYLPAVVVGRRQITGSMDLRFETTQEYQKFLTGDMVPSGASQQAIQILANYGTRGQSDFREFKVTLPKINYDTTKANIDRMERVVQGVDFTAIYDTSSGYGGNRSILIEVQNSENLATFNPAYAAP